MRKNQKLLKITLNKTETRFWDRYKAQMIKGHDLGRVDRMMEEWAAAAKEMWDNASDSTVDILVYNSRSECIFTIKPPSKTKPRKKMRRSLL